MLLGGWLTAAQALDWGLVNRVAPAGQLDATVSALARELADKSHDASRVVKTLVDRGLDLSLAEGLTLEGELAADHMRGSDAREGLAAFAEKRRPVFGPSGAGA
jgi:enoyl-CoA hydratase/carnithine racemase